MEIVHIIVDSPLLQGNKKIVVAINCNDETEYIKMIGGPGRMLEWDKEKESKTIKFGIQQEDSSKELLVIVYGSKSSLETSKSTKIDVLGISSIFVRDMQERNGIRNCILLSPKNVAIGAIHIDCNWKVSGTSCEVNGDHTTIERSYTNYNYPAPAGHYLYQPPPPPPYGYSPSPYGCPPPPQFGYYPPPYGYPPPPPYGYPPPPPYGVAPLHTNLSSSSTMLLAAPGIISMAANLLCIGDKIHDVFNWLSSGDITTS